MVEYGVMTLTRRCPTLFLPPEIKYKGTAILGRWQYLKWGKVWRKTKIIQN
jgi:hypothetical protein